MMVITNVDGRKKPRPYHCPEYTLQLQYDIWILLFQPMFLDKLGEFTEMAFLMKNLTAKLRLSHDAVKMGRDDPIKGTE